MYLVAFNALILFMNDFLRWISDFVAHIFFPYARRIHSLAFDISRLHLHLHRILHTVCMRDGFSRGVEKFINLPATLLTKNQKYDVTMLTDIHGRAVHVHMREMKRTNKFLFFLLR